MSTLFERTVTRQMLRGDVELAEEPTVVAARGHPYALGMLGLAGAAFVVGAYDAEWIPATTLLGTVGVSFIVGAILPILAGILAFTTVRSEGELGTAFAVTGGYFLTSVVLNRLFTATPAPAADIATFMGMAMIVFAVAAAYVAFSLWDKHPGAGVVYGCFAVSLALLSVGQLATSTGWTIAGGYGLMVVAVAAIGMVAIRRFPQLIGR